MPRISLTKEEKIKEAIIHLLFENSPKALFTSAIALNIARDEEYIKRLLLELENKNFIVAVKKSPHGKNYVQRTRWLLNAKVYEAYKSLSKQRIAIDTRILAK